MAGRSDDAASLALFRAIAARDVADVARMLDASDDNLAARAIRSGASRQDPKPYFFDSIGHYAYAGDTALHFAAAAYLRSTAEVLVGKGAGVRARNRRGAEPLHYAADGNPDSQRWDPAAQQDLIAYLVSAGAEPDARDNSGVTAIHRAVRTRCAAAVDALLRNGADPKLGNKTGSTPLHLAVQNTGRSDSGSAAAKEQQREIITLLLQSGAKATDTDAKGKTVGSAATSDWIRDLLA